MKHLTLFLLINHHCDYVMLMLIRHITTLCNMRLIVITNGDEFPLDRSRLLKQSLS